MDNIHVGPVKESLEKFIKERYPKLVASWSKELEACGEEGFIGYEDAQVDDYSVLNAYLDEYGVGIEATLQAWRELNIEQPRLIKETDEAIKEALSETE